VSGLSSPPKQVPVMRDIHEALKHLEQHLPPDLDPGQVVDYIAEHAEELRHPACCGQPLRAPEVFQ